MSIEPFQDVTFMLAILLVAGFLVARLGQLIRLPSVTGYIFAGLLLGPSGIGLITNEAMGNRLEHFTQIALMLIAFGIGEHLEVRRLKYLFKSIGLIGLCETSSAFLFVGVGSFFVACATFAGNPEWAMSDLVVLALLLGAVSVATAPAATLHVMRELKAVGPLTSTLMAVVAVDDGLAIIFFGIAITVAHHVLSGAGSLAGAIVASIGEIFLSLLSGVITGFLIDLTVKKVKSRGEMLTVGLALLLLCGEIARAFHFSPLLAGMAAGFIIINRDRRDVRVFRTLNAFDPPILVLFFTLAGAHLHVSSLAIAGWIGLTYFILRALGKIIGANVGSRLAAAPFAVRKFLGLALMPQAGVAIGLIFFIQSDSGLNMYSSIITPVVLAGVVLSELIGPLCAKFAVEKAGESTINTIKFHETPHNHKFDVRVKNFKPISLVPWEPGRLKSPAAPAGTIVIGGSHPGTIRALTRIATLMAHHHGAEPLAARIIPDKSRRTKKEQEKIKQGLFELAKKEVEVLGRMLRVESIHAKTVPDGIVKIARENKSSAIVVGHPQRKVNEYHRVVEKIAEKAECQLIVARFIEKLHIERILVPVIDLKDLLTVQSLVCALAEPGNHSVTLLRLMPHDSSKEDQNTEKEKLKEWTKSANLYCTVNYKVMDSEALLKSIIKRSRKHDLLIMAAEKTKGLPRLFFGSLSEDVARNCRKSMLIVYDP